MTPSATGNKLTSASSPIAFKTIVAIGAGMFLGVLSANSLPLLVGALLDGLAINNAQAGALGTLELLAVAGATFALASKAGRISCARLAIVGTVIAIAGQLISTLTSSFYLLLIARVVVGAGLGCAYAAAAMAAASTRNPDRAIGYGNTTALGAVALYLPVLAIIIFRFGYQGAYVGLGILCFILIPLLRWLRYDGESHLSAETDSGPAVLPLTALLASIAFFNVAAGAIWGFSERMGVQAGLTVDQIGLIIAAGTISGIIGSALGGWLGDRWGRSIPVMISLLIAGLAYFVLAGAADGVTYIVGINLYWITYMFLFPLFIGAGAALDNDNSGRAATLAAGTISLTIAIGPLCGGLISTWFSYSAIGWFSLAMCLLSAGAFRMTEFSASNRPAISQ